MVYFDFYRLPKNKEPHEFSASTVQGTSFELWVKCKKSDKYFRAKYFNNIRSLPPSLQHLPFVTWHDVNVISFAQVGITVAGAAM